MFGGEDDKAKFNTVLTDEDDLAEIKKIADRLDEDETVLVVARQSRVKPGGSLTTPNIIFATNKRLIIRDPRSLGLRQSIEDISYDRITSARIDQGMLSSRIILRAPGLSTIAEKKLDGITMGSDSNEGQIEAIPKDKAEKIIEAVNQGIQRAKVPTTTIVNNQASIADELDKLAKLKEQGVLSEAEFVQMKQELLKKL
ncbi:Short C-terminal domain [Candidatus Nitrososphaera evergladensis SR1]|uniref:Short C-terminal domain n=1 Tax=Candidatus Nitrososphaera evergladensis SR1 TaxID=1459636 RepID=A0A075MLM9_9ARCH|nr:PH domain-containing protein [Candidatus Nitrososphaera evergladensis]AIF82183.1 Short C-terminal domain [Candidatus Nitrososphaera evergladensis SR1]